MALLVATSVRIDALDATGRVRAPESLRLPRLFADGMVIQRGVAIPVWGWAASGAQISVRLGRNVARAVTDSIGHWMVRLPAMLAGGPYEMSVEAGDARVQVRDILVGDVWVASGQSNMEWTVSVSANAAQEITAAHDSLLRQFKVPTSWAEQPLDTIAGGPWAPADSQHVGMFSGVAYFFARELRGTHHVPIGIINTTWGGSAIETWLSAAAQGMDADGPARALAAERTRLDSTRESLLARVGTVAATDPGMVGGKAVWADPALDVADWRTIRVPALWETQGYDGLDGIAWYRTTFSLTAEEAARGARLSLGPIDDDDITWVNGVQVGRTNSYNVERHYTVPASALRAGPNAVAVRVADYGGGGGIWGAPGSVTLEVGGTSRSLAGDWKFRVGEMAVRMDGQRINKVPTITYNAMAYPLLRVPIKGVIWYQGESNANSPQQARAYRDQFVRLITSWRREWNGATRDFPFLWVQLPNYGPPDSVPNAEPDWALQRESMEAALALPHTGRAVIIDVGNANELHPTNKQDVGRRLALVARAVAYGEHIVASGPTYLRHTVRGGRVVVEFANLGGGLVSRGPDGSAGAFALAGKDRRFVWAQARVEGNRVVVWNDRVPNPVAVRYAWANSPVNANLYNRDGLPAAPFRTDAW
jgi:sialate O-acetylesterase